MCGYLLWLRERLGPKRGFGHGAGGG